MKMCLALSVFLISTSQEQFIEIKLETKKNYNKQMAISQCIHLIESMLHAG